MNKRTSKKNAPITIPIGYLPATGEGGDESIDVSVRRFVEVTIDGKPDPVALNAFEARKLGRALLKAAKRLDAAR